MKKQLIYSTIFVILLTFSLSAQNFNLQSNQSDTTIFPGLSTNSISDIEELNQNTLLIATGRRIARVDKQLFDTDKNSSINTYKKGLLPKGFITAISTYQENIWCAGVYDTAKTTAGGGYSYSLDGGQTWTKVSQSTDEKGDAFEVWNGDTINFLPIITHMQNTTWDLALDGENIYTTSWAGGLRMTSNRGDSWRRLPLPADTARTMKVGKEKVDYYINPRNNNNQMGFSVIAKNDLIWVGTAGGVNKGIYQDSTIAWTHYSVKTDSGLAGDWIKTLYRQEYQGNDIIWATCNIAESGGSIGVSFTADKGNNWHTIKTDTSGANIPPVNDITSSEDTVFIATNRGLYYGILNQGLQSKGWVPLKIEPTQKAEILRDKINSVFADQNYLWIGTGDGLVRKPLNKLADNQIYHEYVKPGTEKTENLYAYPNPFYPNHTNKKGGEGHVRIRFNIPEVGAEARFIIYDFNMEMVYKSEKQSFATQEGSYFTWNGRRENGSLVANGTYFCKLVKETEQGTKINWTKIIVVK